MVLGEAALQTLVCNPETLAGQLSKLLSVIRLPALELGIIGFSQRMPRCRTVLTKRCCCITKYEVANTHVGSRSGTTVTWPEWC